jgi:hypothetical protein
VKDVSAVMECGEAEHSCWLIPAGFVERRRVLLSRAVTILSAQPPLTLNSSIMGASAPML